MDVENISAENNIAAPLAETTIPAKEDIQPILPGIPTLTDILQILLTLQEEVRQDRVNQAKFQEEVRQDRANQAKFQEEVRQDRANQAKFQEEVRQDRANQAKFQEELATLRAEVRGLAVTNGPKQLSWLNDFLLARLDIGTLRTQPRIVASVR